MLVANDVSRDGRVCRMARSLARHGYDVTVGGISPTGERIDRADGDGYRIRLVPTAIARARRAKASSDEIHAELRQLMELEGPPRSKRSRIRIRQLREKAADLKRERRVLKERAVRSRQGAVDRAYRSGWAGLIRGERPDLIHVHDYHGLATALAIRRAGTRVIYDAHEYVPGKDHHEARRAAILRYWRSHAPRADAVITVGAAIASRLSEELNLPAPPTVVHNAPPLRDQRPPPYDLRAKIGLDPTSPLVVYAGGMSLRRRLPTLVEALPKLPSVHLAFVVPTHKRQVALLAETAQRLGVDERVHFAPLVPPECLVSLLRAADVAVHPLDRYSNGDLAMPNKLFQYLHAGLPMVVSDSPEIANFVRGHRLGEIVPVDDPHAWARAIERILTHPDGYRGDPKELEQLRRTWSWETQEEVVLDLYTRLLDHA